MMSWTASSRRYLGTLVSRAHPFWARIRPDLWTESQWLARSKAYWRSGWQADPRGDVNHPQAYWAGGVADASYTPDLMRFLCDCPSPQSLLEIGCNAGRNLFHVSQRFPDCKLIGIDLNPDAVAFAKANVPGAESWDLRVGDLTDPVTLAAIPTASADYVFSMAVLVHMPPGDIKARLMRECLRIARRGVLLIEPHRAGEITWNMSADRRVSPFSIDDYTRYAPMPPAIVKPTCRGEADLYRVLFFPLSR